MSQRQQPAHETWRFNDALNDQLASWEELTLRPFFNTQRSQHNPESWVWDRRRHLDDSSHVNASHDFHRFCAFWRSLRRPSTLPGLSSCLFCQLAVLRCQVPLWELAVGVERRNTRLTFARLLTQPAGSRVTLTLTLALARRSVCVLLLYAGTAAQAQTGPTQPSFG